MDFSKPKRLVLIAAGLFGMALVNVVTALPAYQWHIMGGTGVFALMLLAASYWPPLWRKR